MQLPRLPQNRRANLGARLGSLAFALLLTAPAAISGASVTGLRPEAAVAASQTSPAYPDAVHVTNGCHISTVTFLARFLTEFPGERDEPLVITMLNADGVRRPHTIALLSWQGQWWCRDESFGVFALGCPVEAQPDLRRLNRKSEIMLEKHAQMLIRAALATPRPVPPSAMSSEERMREVTAAARMIPFATTVFWVKCGSREVPVAFFRPNAQQVAVYDPLHGTCVAQCSSRNDAKVVALVASQLGYHVDAIHAELTNPRGVLVASADRPRAYAQ